MAESRSEELVEKFRQQYAKHPKWNHTIQIDNHKCNLELYWDRTWECFIVKISNGLYHVISSFRDYEKAKKCYNKIKDKHSFK